MKIMELARNAHQNVQLAQFPLVVIYVLIQTEILTITVHALMVFMMLESINVLFVIQVAQPVQVQLLV
jgi:hypothetical protein